MSKFYGLVYGVLRVLSPLLLPWRVVGNTAMPEGGVLLCGNHAHFTDPIYVLLALGRRQECRVMGKAELYKVPVLNLILKGLRMIGIDRGKADVAALKECIKTLKTGERLLMFPEGTRVKEGQQVEPHTGAAMLATRTGVPIVPIYLPRQKRFFHRMTVVLGDPYYPEFEGKKATPEDYERITADLMERIYGLKERVK